MQKQIRKNREKEFDRALALVEPVPKIRAVIKAQAVLETGNFNSSLCDGYNYFGIRWFRKKGVKKTRRDTKAHGETYYRVYDSPQHGLEEYLSVVRRLHTKAWAVRDNPLQYIYALSGTWCPIDKEYKNKWLRCYNPKKEVLNMNEYLNLITKFVSRRIGVGAGAMWLIATKGPTIGVALSICIAAVALGFIICQTYLDGKKKQ